MPEPGQLPPSVSPAPANAGPVSIPQGSQGNTAQAMSLVRNGLEMFQKALPMIPMGAPLHSDILKAVSSVSKHMEQNSGNKGIDMQSLIQMARQSSQNSPVEALNRLHPAPPSAAPAMPTTPA